jgi:hypothetical protein
VARADQDEGCVFYLFLILLAVVGVGVYLVFILREVPGAAEERLGRLVLPDDVGTWKLDQDSDAAVSAMSEGLEREVRLLWDPDAGFLRRGKLVRQVRYRRQETRAIERVEPDQVVKLRRVRS